MKWLRRILKWAGLGLAGLVVAGAVYQQIGTMLDAGLAPPASEMVTVAGRSVHLKCVGEGPRTYLLDGGLGAGVFEWWRLQPLLARAGRVCAFDRAGLGWSMPATSVRDGAVAAEELAALVRTARIATPFVYVGHSLGANYAMIYAARHPGDVSALILVEPGMPKDLLEDFHGSRAEAMAASDCGAGCYAAGAAAYLGITRLAAQILTPGSNNLAGRARDEYRAGLARPSTVMTMVKELNAVPGTAFEDLDVRSFGATPVLVFTSSRPRDPEGKETVSDVAKWRAVQLAWLASLAAKSSRGEGPVVVPDSSHASMVMGETQAEFMARTIDGFLSKR